MTQNITTLLLQRTNELKPSQNTSSTNSTALALSNNPTSASTKLLAKIPTPQQFLTTFNPSTQVRYSADNHHALAAKTPSLTLVADTYGLNTAEAWIEIQLNELSEFTGCKGKLDNAQTEQTAQIILNSYPHLTISQLMTFFQRFKRCEYGKFYGAVDPIVILGALRDFIHDLNYQLNILLQEKQKQIKANNDALLLSQKQEYRRRIPGAFTPDAIIDWPVYSLLHLYELSDSQISRLILNIRTGKTKLPSFVQIITSPQPTLFDL